MRSFSKSVPALVEALCDNPFYRAITIDFGTDTAARKRALTHYFEYSLDEAARVGRCRVGSQPELGAAAWLLPVASQVAAGEAAAKADYLASVLGPRGNESYHSIVRFMAPRAKQLVPADAWYLSIVGVSPIAQSRGVGADLLRPTLEEASAAAVVCYLETFSPRTFAFYERMGFRHIAAHHEPTTMSQYFIMRRDG